MEDEKLTKEELERQRTEQLPDREVMSTLNPSVSPGPIVPLDDGPFPVQQIPTK